jgi:hypothetical protein
MMIDFCKTEIFEGQMAHLRHGGGYRQFTRAHLLEEFY